MKRLATTALLALGLLGLPTAAAARHHKHPTAHQHEAVTFSGSCQFSGIVEFRPPLTNTGRRVRDIARAKGTCSGRLTGRRGTHQLDAVPVSYLATDVGTNGSCGGSLAAAGRGELRFSVGNLRFRLSETRASGVAVLTLTGAGGGSAGATATISPSANPIQIINACAGRGLREAPVDIRLQASPTISG